MTSLFTFNIYKIFLHISKPFAFKSFEVYAANSLNIVGFTVVLALLFMLVEKFLIKKTMPFSLQFMLKIGFSFLILILPFLFIFYFKDIQNLFFESNLLLILTLILVLGRGFLREKQTKNDFYNHKKRR